MNQYKNVCISRNTLFLLGFNSCKVILDFITTHLSSQLSFNAAMSIFNTKVRFYVRGPVKRSFTVTVVRLEERNTM